jgi:hypothetical protein
VFDGESPALSTRSRACTRGQRPARGEPPRGTLRGGGPGLVALELSRDDRTFFHNGIVFAALDAVNDP